MATENQTNFSVFVSSELLDVIELERFSLVKVCN